MQYKLIALIIAFLFTTSLNADSLSALKKLEKNVQYHQLSNGIRVITYKRGIAPVFTGFISFRVGGVDEVPGETGIAHMLEHMAFKGSKKIGTKNYSKERGLLERLEKIYLASNAGNSFTKEQSEQVATLRKQLEEIWDNDNTIDKIYRRIGGVGLNATTSSELTNYFVSLPKNAFELWCHLESDRILNPVFRQFYKERDVVAEERRMRIEDSPGGTLYEKLLFTAYHKHPYRNSIVGHAEDIKHLTATMITDFHKEYYVPSNIVIALVGDVSASDIEMLEKYFGQIPEGPNPSRTHLVENQQEGERSFTLHLDSEPELVIAYHKLNYPNYDDVPLTLWLELMLGTKTAPLYKELVIDRQLASMIDYSEAPGSVYPNLYYIHAKPQGTVSNETLLKEVDRIMQREIAKGVDTKQLEIIKRKQAVNYIDQLDSNKGLASYLAYAEQIYGDWKYISKWFEDMNKTDEEDIMKAAKKYLKKTNRIVGKIERKK